MGATANGMGGASTPQAGAPNTNLQNLFMANAPTNPAGGGAQLPQIMAPVRPPVQMPPRIPLPQAAAPVAPAAAAYQPRVDYGSTGGQGGGRWGPGGWAKEKQMAALEAMLGKPTATGPSGAPMWGGLQGRINK